MKRLLVIIAMLLPLFVMAQGSSPVDKLLDKYAEKPGFKRVEISGKLFASMRYGTLLANPMFDEAMKKVFSQTQNTLQKITGISILSIEDNVLPLWRSLDFYKELNEEGFFKSNSYEVLMEVKGSGNNSNVHFFGRIAPENKYSELLLIIGGYEKKVISIRGTIDPMEIGQITKALDVDINRYSK